MTTGLDGRNATRDERVLAAARVILETRGLASLTRDAIAQEAGVSAASVSNFGLTRLTRYNSRRADQRRENPIRDSTNGFRPKVLLALMADAVERADLAMLRIGLADGCIRAADVPEALRGDLGLG